MVAIADTRVRLAARMYEMRATYQQLAGSQYRELIAEYMDCLRAAQAKWQCGTLAAAKRIIEDCQAERPFDSPITTVAIIAAAVEMMEPSEA